MSSVSRTIPKCMSIFVLGNTSELRPGGSGVAVVLRNLLVKDITLESHTEAGDEKVQCMLAQVESSDLSAGFQQGSIDPEDILQKLDLSRFGDWDPQNDLVLGRTFVVKHSIKLNDPTPFTECY